MPPKTVEEQLAELEMEAEAPAPPPKKAAKTQRQRFEQDADALKQLEELEALEKFQRPDGPRPSSRPNTPKPPSSSTSSNRRTAGVVTPSSTGSARTSEDRAAAPRKSGESTTSFHQSFAPTEEEPAKPAAPAPAPADTKLAAEPSWWGGGWGGILSTATEAANAAKKQAEAAYQELQKNQEAQRWAEQVRGNVGALRGIGGELGKRALPTFTTILHTLAPPISQHERLQIHITHDFIGYPSLDPIIYQTFSSVMAQVEGGDLMVIQRGSESTQRSSVDGYRGGGGGWNDGPWWRDTEKRDLGVVTGMVEGTKLVRVSAEAYANEFFAARGGIEQAAQQATEVLSETNPVRSSDIFLAIQAISFPAQSGLFATSLSEEKGDVEERKEEDEQVAFAIYLHDPIHGISFNAVSQSFPAKWAHWLDASANTEAAGEEGQVPDEIRQIIETGGVDPREWVSEWMEDSINLSVGIVAQRYVARRMGVGEGGLGRGKAREAILEAGGGEAARAGII
ncbi:maintenance of telomere capping protein 1 [Ampelomyces quisqualis]|uniref:Maintenance of telomere capping protein 1 n=1 Tax=Ampelomyces quisqualis TaxID=50730 RepID=A0A6A5QLF8_AMPQU|nr:maintenance of telomere capping protein 1 [Ampelomyces quisqualis]